MNIFFTGSVLIFGLVNNTSNIPYGGCAAELKTEQIVHQDTIQGRRGRGMVGLCLLLNIALAGYASMTAAAAVSLVWPFLLA